LIAQLGSDSFEAREAATRRLMECDEALPSLRQAQKSTDAEVARRAGEILTAFVRKEKERAFAQLAELAKHGAVDRAVEQLVRGEKGDDADGCWQVMADLAGKLTDLERKCYGEASWPAGYIVKSDNFNKLAVSLQLKIVGARADPPELRNGLIVLRAEEIEASHLYHCLFAVSGCIKARKVSQSVLFSGGSTSISGAYKALIVCDGDFTAGSGVIDSLIIARGTITCETEVVNSRLISGGEVRLIRAKTISGSKVVERQAKPLGLVKFFDPAEVGLKVESGEDRIRVKEATKGQRFATAGLRPDDVIAAIDGTPVKDVEAFRRLLRAKLAVEGEMVFQVRRGEKVVEIPVKHRD